MSKNKNKNNKIKISKSPLEQIKVSNDISGKNKLIISYEFLCLNNNKYSLDLLSDYRTAVKSMKEYYKKINEYCGIENFKLKISSDVKYRQNNHIHPIDWSDNQIREDGFNCLKPSLMEQIRSDCWQLGINNQGFRIHGFFIENIYYVVWLDPTHQLFARKG